MNWLQKLLHKHDFVEVSRTLIGIGERDMTTSGFMVDIQPTNRYIGKGYCFKCDVKMERKYEILHMFDKKQPYDT